MAGCLFQWAVVSVVVDERENFSMVMSWSRGRGQVQPVNVGRNTWAGLAQPRMALGDGWCFAGLGAAAAVEHGFGWVCWATRVRRVAQRES